MCSCLGRPREHLNRSIVGSGFTQFRSRFASKMAPSSRECRHAARISPRPVLGCTFRATKPKRSPSSSDCPFRKIHPFAVARPSAAAHQVHGTRRSVSRAQIHPIACAWQAFLPLRARSSAHYHLWRPVSNAMSPSRTGEAMQGLPNWHSLSTGLGQDLACPVGGIGRHTWFRSKRESMGVRVPHRAPLEMCACVDRHRHLRHLRRDDSSS